MAFYIGTHTPQDLPPVGSEVEDSPSTVGTVIGYEFSDRAPCSGYVRHQIWWEKEGGWMMVHPTDPNRGPIAAPNGVKISPVIR